MSIQEPDLGGGAFSFNCARNNQEYMMTLHRQQRSYEYEQKKLANERLFLLEKEARLLAQQQRLKIKMPTMGQMLALKRRFR